jgi:hypothetical protein
MTRAFSAQIDFTRDEFYVVLATTSYWPEKGIDEFRSDVTHEVTAPGYAKGELAVGLSASRTAGLLFGGAIWPHASITARYAVYSSGTAARRTIALARCRRAGMGKHCKREVLGPSSFTCPDLGVEGLG